MRIFIVGTGRCGTTTAYYAAKHVTNFTAGHESSAGHLELIEYPNDHIEIDAHLSMTMGMVMKRYPDAKWVHLIRSRESCVESLSEFSRPNLERFAAQWMQVPHMVNPVDYPLAAGLYYDMVNANISRMLAYTDHLRIHLGDAKTGWRLFWNHFLCEGDVEASLKEWDIKYNARPPLERPSR